MAGELAILPLQEGTSTMLVAPPGHGKTFLVLQIIRQAKQIYREPPEKILYYYGQYQEKFANLENEIDNFSLIPGLPTEEQLQSLGRYSHSLVVIDDQALRVVQSEQMCDLFCRITRHARVSLFYLCHNMFLGGKFARTIALSCGVMILFRQSRDLAQINYLGRQLFPTCSKKLMEVYNDATRNKYGYIMISFLANTPPELQLLTNILPSDDHLIAYHPL